MPALRPAPVNRNKLHERPDMTDSRPSYGWHTVAGIHPGSLCIIGLMHPPAILFAGRDVTPLDRLRRNAQHAEVGLAQQLQSTFPICQLTT